LNNPLPLAPPLTSAENTTSPALLNALMPVSVAKVPPIGAGAALPAATATTVPPPDVFVNTELLAENATTPLSFSRCETPVKKSVNVPPAGFGSPLAATLRTVPLSHMKRPVAPEPPVMAALNSTWPGESWHLIAGLKGANRRSRAGFAIEQRAPTQANEREVTRVVDYGRQRQAVLIRQAKRRFVGQN